jgi:hypothetical protein
MEIAALIATGVILSSALWLPLRPRLTSRKLSPSEIAPREREIQVFSMRDLQKDVEILSKG